MSGQGIQLYVGLLGDAGTPWTHDDCFATLSLQERRRAARFVLDRQRREYVVAHGLLRYALSDSAPQVEPSDWSFATDRHGRPFVAGPEIGKTIFFSLSHTDGCVACVVSGDREVGVDAERVRDRDRGSLLQTALTAFSAEEVEILRQLPPRDFVDRFFVYWTLKEAYLKAKGRGLSLPLNQFSILISAEKIALKLDPDMADDSGRWHFTTVSPSAHHRLAIADGSGTPGGLPVVVRPWPVSHRIVAS